MIMISNYAFDVLVWFLVLGLCWNQLDASRQVTLTCGRDDATKKDHLVLLEKDAQKALPVPQAKKIYLCSDTIIYSNL